MPAEDQPKPASQSSLFTPLGVIMLAALSGMTVFECVKQAVHPEISIWQSHAVTIAFSTFVATAAGYVVLRRIHRAHRGTVDELAARKRAEAELRSLSATLEQRIAERTAMLQTSEQRYRVLFDDSPISLWEEDWSPVKRYLDELRSSHVEDFSTYFQQHPDAVDHCVHLVGLTETNKASARLFEARDKTELLANLQRLIAEESLDVIAGLLAALAAGETDYSAEELVLTMPGRKKRVIFFFRAVPGYEESLERVLVSLIDVTELRQAEQALHRAERLASIGTLTAGIAHEINNPISAAWNSAHVAIRVKNDPESTALLGDSLQNIIDAVGRCRDIIRSLLAFATQQYPEKRRQNLNEVVRSAVERIGDKTPNATIELRLDERLPPARIDAIAFERVLINLIDNAIESAEEPVRVTIRTSESGRGIRLVVEDNGGGIPDDLQRRVFEPFLTTKQEHGGTGLGLSIVHAIVAGHDGEVEIESAVGEGTAVKIELPIAVDDATIT